ncbi:hypothetical protein RA19_04320 [Leisingera sp. ANG-M1]|uniref:hypothetical protein n=1 Tax=Leisingera sp. ANG-M1 TaxID=1577895 RepID=UPI00057D27AF|nr:hypothetical protein [Leisingera sp. ANG-M1]KIC11868.1 hypothetical protein RA19_04320 [Leisingera sp. ANG-M1]
MSNLNYEFDYKPTLKELKSGGRLVFKNLYSGPWQLAVAVKSLFFGLTGLVVGLIVAMNTFKRLNVAISDAPLAYYGLVLIVGLAVLLTLAALSYRPVKVFHKKLQDSNLKAKVSAEGIELHSPEWKYFSSWAKLDAPREKGEMLVFGFAHLGFVFSDRMFEPIGEPAVVRAQIIDWYRQQEDKRTQ